MLDDQCTTGLSLFPESNSTVKLFGRLAEFRSFYEPYHAYICFIICTFGVITNVINILVLTNRQMRTSVNILLTGIAVCDMATMLSYLIYITHFVLLRRNCDNTLSFGWMLWLVNHVMWSIAFHSTDLWLAVAVAFIRRMTLKDVRLGSKWTRRENAWKISTTISCAVFALCLPNLFSQHVEDVTEYLNDTCWREIQRGARFYSIGIPNCAIYEFNLWLNGVVMKVIPCVMLAVLSGNLLSTLRRAEVHRAKLMLKDQVVKQQAMTKRFNNHKTRSDRTTLMLVVILFIFLATELPQGILAMLSNVFPKDVRHHVYPNVGDVMDLLSLINSSVNFFLYCGMSSKYRHVFWKVLLPRKLYIRLYIRGPKVVNSNSKSTGYDTKAPMTTKVLKISRAQNNTSWEYKETYVDDHI